MHILIIDDNRTITENISLYLKAKWHTASIAYDGEMAFDMITRSKYDFLIVDRMMPHIDWLSLIRMLSARSIRIPFLFLTALSKQVDKIEGLSLGADDYLVKPFDLDELVLRIENISRRNTNTHFPASSDAHSITFGNIEIDFSAELVKQHGNRIDLSPKEYHLLRILMKNKGKVLSRDFLYEEVWWDYDVSEKVLDTINVHIAHLRKKLSSDLIRTVKLSGYIID